MVIRQRNRGSHGAGRDYRGDGAVNLADAAPQPPSNATAPCQRHRAGTCLHPRRWKGRPAPEAAAAPGTAASAEVASEGMAHAGQMSSGRAGDTLLTLPAAFVVH